MNCPRVARLWIQPVKSLRGHEVTEARIDRLGFVGDRRFLVVDPSGRFMTQRATPRMATVTAALRDGEVELAAAGMPPLRVPLVATGPAATRTVAIWKSEGLIAEDCGADAAAWLTAALETPCALVRAGDGFDRPIPLHRLPAAVSHGPRVAFPDAFPFKVLGEATLDDLNARLRAQGSPPVPMERFRPSFTIEHAAPSAEDGWSRFRIGSAVFHVAGPCARCILITIDPWTGAGGHEPLRLLAKYRRDPQDPQRVNFGQNVVHAPEAVGAIVRVGDAVEPEA